jgi:hypothetical protein
MSSQVYPVETVTVAPPLQPVQQDDDEAMLQMFAAFGSLYESAAKIHDVCSKAKMTLESFYGEYPIAKPVLQ